MRRSRVSDRPRGTGDRLPLRHLPRAEGCASQASGYGSRMNVHELCLRFAVESKSPVERIALLLIARRIEASQETGNLVMAVFNVVGAHIFGATLHRVATYVPPAIRPDPRSVN